MKLKKIREGLVNFYVPVAKRIYDASVFYNPEMIANRDISVLICKILKPKRALDLLAATGIRGLRLKKEAKIEEVYINDANPEAAKLIKKNALLNKLKVKSFNLRAHELLATRYKFVKGTKFDYIDVDPFGTPSPFLDASVKALEKDGVIGITATDTSALCGAYPEACLRKYSSKPLKNELMHELGVRILIKKAQEVAAQYDIALIPIFSYATKHYMRVYLRAEHGAKAADEVLRKIGSYSGAGPMWLGDLWDENLVEEMHKLARLSRISYSSVKLEKGRAKELAKEIGIKVPTTFKISYETERLLYEIAEESKIHTFGFFDVHAIAKKMKLGNIPKMTNILAKLHKKGFEASRTHFTGTGIRTDADLASFKKLLD